MVHRWNAFEPGASGLPYYCTPGVPAAIGALAVCLQNIKKKSGITTHKIHHEICKETIK